jgi:hypothetical protein
MAVDLSDPKQVIQRWVLRAGAKIHRAGTNPAEFIGLLTSEPRLGAPLVLVLDGRRRLRTSPIERIESGPDRSVYVDTRNNRYRIDRLV